MSIPWMPLYVADYLADTGHLNAAEHGAYLLLLMHAWRTGKIPNDDRSLASITRMSARQWVAMRPKIETFFEPGWVHGRLMSEYKKAQDKSLARAEAGARGGYAKALKTQETTLANASSPPEQSPTVALPSSSPSLSEVISQEEITSASLRSASPAKRKPKRKTRSEMPPDLQPSPQDREVAEKAGMSAEVFRREWGRFRDNHIARGSLMADWRAAWRTWCGNFKAGVFAGASRGPPRMTGGDFLARVATGQLDPFAPLNGAPHDEPIAFDLDLTRAAAPAEGIARLPRLSAQRDHDDAGGQVIDLRPEDADRRTA